MAFQTCLEISYKFDIILQIDFTAFYKIRWKHCCLRYFPWKASKWELHPPKSLPSKSLVLLFCLSGSLVDGGGGGSSFPFPRCKEKQRYVFTAGMEPSSFVDTCPHLCSSHQPAEVSAVKRDLATHQTQHLSSGPFGRKHTQFWDMQAALQSTGSPPFLTWWALLRLTVSSCRWWICSTCL